MSSSISSSPTTGGAFALAGSGFVRIVLGIALAVLAQQGGAEPGHGDRGDRGDRGARVGGMPEFRSFDDRLPWQRRTSSREQDNEPDVQPAPVRPAAKVEVKSESKPEAKTELRPEPRYNSSSFNPANVAAPGNGHLTEEERRNLRQSIQDAGREVYRPKP